MSRGESRQYWAAQLVEYWDSGFSIQEYGELKELPFENTKRWIRVFEKERNEGLEKSHDLSTKNQCFLDSTIPERVPPS